LPPLKVLIEGQVFRLAKLGGGHFKQGAKKPHPAFFKPSSDDEREAKEKGTSVRLTVWDCERTSIEQCRAIRKFNAAIETVAIALLVDSVNSIGIPEQSHSLRVVRDPLDDPAVAAMPGAKGHCGIEGLGKDTNLCSNERKVVRDKLVEKAFLLDE